MHRRYLCQNCLWAVRNTYLATKKETRLSWTTICQNSFWSRWHASAWMWQQLLNWVFACQKVIVSLQGFVTFKLRQTPKIDSFHCKDQQGKKRKKNALDMAWMRVSISTENMRLVLTVSDRSSFLTCGSRIETAVRSSLLLCVHSSYIHAYVIKTKQSSV